MNEKVLVGAIVTNVEITEDSFIINFIKDRQVGVISLFYSEWFYIDKITLDGVEITSSKQQFEDNIFIEKTSNGIDFKKQLARQLPFGWNTVEAK